MMYLVKADALNRAKERSGATENDEVYLTELLDISAGIDTIGTQHFRPFYVAAKFIEQNQTVHTLKEADAVVFTGLPIPIASLLALQAAYDAANSLIIPPGFEAITPQSITPSPIFSTRVLRTKVLF